jgi:hypothetical protein
MDQDQVATLNAHMDETVDVPLTIEQGYVLGEVLHRLLFLQRKGEYELMDYEVAIVQQVANITAERIAEWAVNE